MATHRADRKLQDRQQMRKSAEHNKADITESNKKNHNFDFNTTPQTRLGLVVLHAEEIKNWKLKLERRERKYNNPKLRDYFIILKDLNFNYAG